MGKHYVICGGCNSTTEFEVFGTALKCSKCRKELDLLKALEETYLSLKEEEKDDYVVGLETDLFDEFDKRKKSYSDEGLDRAADVAEFVVSKIEIEDIKKEISDFCTFVVKSLRFEANSLIFEEPLNDRISSSGTHQGKFLDALKATQKFVSTCLRIAPSRELTEASNELVDCLLNDSAVSVLLNVDYNRGKKIIDKIKELFNVDRKLSIGLTISHLHFINVPGHNVEMYIVEDGLRIVHYDRKQKEWLKLLEIRKEDIVEIAASTNRAGMCRILIEIIYRGAEGEYREFSIQQEINEDCRYEYCDGGYKLYGWCVYNNIKFSEDPLKVIEFYKSLDSKLVVTKPDIKFTRKDFKNPYLKKKESSFSAAIFIVLLIFFFPAAVIYLIYHLIKSKM